MTKIKVENKDRKKTVKVRATATGTKPTTSAKRQTGQSATHTTQATQQSLIDRVEKLEASFTGLKDTVKAVHKADSRMIHSLYEMDFEAGKRVGRLAWGLFIVFIIFVIVFGIVLN